VPKFLEKLTMPIEIVKEVEKRCKAGNLKPWESNLMKKNNLDCHGIGEAVAAIVDAKRKRESKLSLEEFYESLVHVDIDEASEIYGTYLKDKKKKKTFEILGKEIFAVGEWNGDPYTEKDLDNMVDAFQKLDFKPFLKINHDKNKENEKVSDLRPALGFISNLYRKGTKLLGDFSCIPKKLFDAIDSGAYNRVSAEIFWNLKRMGKTWPRALKAVSILGTDLPAVESLDGLNALYEIEGKAVSCYEGEDKAKVYELEVEEGKLKEFFMEPLAWEELADMYVYPVRPKISFMEIKEEEISDGVTRFFGELVSGMDDNATAGYGFDKSVFTLRIAKKWIDERRFSKKEEFKEYQAITKTDGGVKFPKQAYAFVPDPEKPSTWKIRLWESPTKKITARQVGAAIAAFSPGGFRGQKVQIPSNKIAGVKAKVRAAWKKANPDKDPKKGLPRHVFSLFFTEEEAQELFFTEEGGTEMDEKELQKLQDELEAKTKELAAKATEVEELKTAQKASTEAAEKTEKESSDKLAELTSEKEKLDAELKKQKEEVTKFEKEKEEAKEKARITEIQSFISKQKQEGRVLPRFEAPLEALLKASPSEEKVIKYSIDKEEKEFSFAETIRNFVSALPKLVNFAEISAGGELDTISDDAEAQFDAAVKKVMKDKNVTYSQALQVVKAEFPQLVEAYIDKKEEELS
jgi:hypothetical protein